MDDRGGTAVGPDAGRREYAGTLAGLAAGGGLALLVAQASWVTATEAEVGYLTSLRGTEVASAVVACALVAIAGAVGVIATRGLGRRVVGGVLAVVGLVLVVGPVEVLIDPSAAARHPLALVTGGADALPKTVSVAWWWCLLAALGGVLVVAAGALTVVRGNRWPVMAARYEAPGGGRRSSPAAADAWTQLDRGQDPTMDGPVEPPDDLQQ